MLFSSSSFNPRTRVGCDSTTVVFTIDLQESIVVAIDDKGDYGIDACPITADNPHLNPLLKDLLKR